MHVQHTADDNTAIWDKTFGWRSERRWILQHVEAFRFIFVEKEIIEKSAFHLSPFYVEKLIFLLLYFLCRQLTLGVHASEIYFVFNVDDFHSYQRSEEENERQRYGKCLFEGEKKKCLNLFVKALIDKTSDKFITCKIQFDATLLWLASTTAIEAYYLSIQFGFFAVKLIDSELELFYGEQKETFSFWVA